MPVSPVQKSTGIFGSCPVDADRQIVVYTRESLRLRFYSRVSLRCSLQARNFRYSVDLRLHMCVRASSVGVLSRWRERE